MKALLVLFAMILSGLSSAQAYRNDFDLQRRSGSESFRQTCTIRYESRDRIQADCLTENGRLRYNDYQKVSCSGDLANLNGRIICSRGNGGDNDNGYHDDYGNGRLPPGSYRQTCTDCRISGSTLQCSCLDGYGGYLYASIQYRQCPNNIGNIHGRLVCY